MKETEQPLSELARCMTKFPQILVNVPVKERRPFDAIPGLSARVAELEAAMDGSGRILLRYSGTESLARVMIEGEKQGDIERVASELAGMIHAAIGQ
jgi:phosphoglucosamine mutase